MRCSGRAWNCEERSWGLSVDVCALEDPLGFWSISKAFDFTCAGVSGRLPYIKMSKGSAAGREKVSKTEPFTICVGHEATEAAMFLG